MRVFPTWIAQYTSMPSPLGILWVARSEAGVVAVNFGVDELEFCCTLELAGADPIRDGEALREVVAQLQEYFEGTRTEFDIPIDLSRVSPFQRSILEAVQAVPYGHVQSYAGIARAAGKPGATRAAGSAIATNPLTLIIPCHRVIRADGTLGEYALRSLGRRGVEYKMLLLSLEGVPHQQPKLPLWESPAL